MLRWLGFGIVLSCAAPALADPLIDLSDPALDDFGPGNYVYPNHPVFFRRGIFDLRRFRVKDAGKNWRIEMWMTRPTERPVEKRATRARWLRFEQDIYFQNLDLYIRTPDAAEDELHDEAVPGRNVRFAAGHEWNRAVVFTPFPFQVRTLIVDWKAREQAILPDTIRAIGPRFFALIPKTDLGPSEPSTWRFALLVSGSIPLTQDYRRADRLNVNALTMPVRPNPGVMNFAGADLSPYNPSIIDLLAPTEAQQREMLAPDDPVRRTESVRLRLLTVADFAASGQAH
jgi:hypothetical protein